MEGRRPDRACSPGNGLLGRYGKFQYYDGCVDGNYQHDPAQNIHFGSSAPTFLQYDQGKRRVCDQSHSRKADQGGRLLRHLYRRGRTEMYVLGGIVLIIPVHATVIILEFSISPEETITGGTGAIKAPPFHFIFDIFLPLNFCNIRFTFRLYHITAEKSINLLEAIAF